MYIQLIRDDNFNKIFLIFSSNHWVEPEKKHPPSTEAGDFGGFFVLRLELVGEW